MSKKANTSKAFGASAEDIRAIVAEEIARAEKKKFWQDYHHKTANDSPFIGSTGGWNS